MDAIKFLQDLTVVLLIGAAVLLLFQRFKQPPVLGYLAAGLFIGPGTGSIQLVADQHSLEALAQIGVVFLLFALGVEFNLKRLAKVGWRALAAALVEVSLLTGAGYGVGVAVGMTPIAAMLAGAMVAFASTAVVARLLMDYGGGGRQGWGEMAGGMLIAEDLLAVVMIAFFTSAGRIGGGLEVAEVFAQLFRFGMFVTVTVVSGLLILPGILTMVESSGMKEVRTLVIIGTCFGISFLTETLGFSAGLGAFLAGTMMSETASATRLRETVEPFKEVFGAVFFVAVGMMIDLDWVTGHWQLCVVLIAAVSLGRFAANFIALSSIGEEQRSSMKSSVARLPIGEFSFLLAQVGDRFRFSETSLYPLAVMFALGTTLVSAALMPAAQNHPERFERWVPKRVSRFLEEYRGAVQRLYIPARMKLILNLIRPSVVQIVLNLLGLSAMFLSAGWARDRWGLDAAVPGALWLGVSIVCFPFLLALWRKSQAVTLILLEAATSEGGDALPPAEKHPAVTRLFLGMTTVVVAWWYISVSLPLLPRWPYTLIPLAVMALAGAFIWRHMNKLYARIQVNLRGALAEGKADAEASTAVVAHLVADGARVLIEDHKLSSKSGAVGRTLAELDLRALTGVSVVQINRDGERFVPDSHGKLREGDVLLLAGLRADIEKAKAFLEDSPST